ncbi:Josephin-domain-containing protein [Pholiota conissans]|uniref:ubiquitinyl hydrolase 1 n=1 Tax=Pholiota conissans TaxID=109636 RepID=A0A9P5YX89_9AGAR|nr:Josephin-domain-containing protein [Pholiota conissans]
MASLETLIPYIYHERQQDGSMLCAQHALNSLLQGNYFTAPDLSDLARSLDDLEESYDDSNMGHTSTNMDDTGFFSVQVLDNALKVWGLNLTRWRSEEMRPYHGNPHTQLAFILNLEQHWFTMRRFGMANADVDLDDGNGHWFNLNSFLPAPEWVGKLYLGMVLQQAEAEGYSVFAVTQADPNAPLALPRTEADVISSTLPEPTSSPITRIQRPFASSSNSAGKDLFKAAPVHEGFDDEDYELQAALQASLLGAVQPSVPAAPPIASLSPLSSPTGGLTSPDGSGSRSRTPSLQSQTAAPILLPGHADIDPVAASVERNRVLLQRMREQQELAQREMWSESDLTPEEQTALQERREHRRIQEEEEDTQLRRAIEESEALAHEQRTQRESNPDTEMHDGIAGDHTRYDDEDSELQAALKASLESAGLPSSVHAEADDDVSVVSDTTSTDVTAEPPSLEEIRKRRLARFGL